MERQKKYGVISIHIHVDTDKYIGNIREVGG